MKVRILAVLVFIGLAFFLSGCDESDSTSKEQIGNFDPSTISTINWMSKLGDNKKLNQIVLPGSHDAGMSECTDCSFPQGIMCALCKTQIWDIEHQLHAGTRYFDIRLGFENGQIVKTYHRNSDGKGCDGETFPHLMEGVARFLIQHPSEFVIFKFSHWRNTPCHYPDTTKLVVNQLLTAWEEIFKNLTHDRRELLYKNPVTTFDNILNTPVSELRGKILAIFEDYTTKEKIENGILIPAQNLYDPSEGRLLYWDIGPCPWDKPGWERTNFPVYDEYSDTPNLNAMKNDQLIRLDTFGGLNKPYLFVLSWTLTPQWHSSLNVLFLAKTANAILPATLYDIWLKQKLPNIVYIDRVTVETNQYIIQYNDDVRMP